MQLIQIGMLLLLGLLDYNDLVEIRNVIDKQLDEWDNK
jgi:hypothetical protein